MTKRGRKSQAWPQRHYHRYNAPLRDQLHPGDLPHLFPPPSSSFFPLSASNVVWLLLLPSLVVWLNRSTVCTFPPCRFTVWHNILISALSQAHNAIILEVFSCGATLCPLLCTARSCKHGIMKSWIKQMWHVFYINFLCLLSFKYDFNCLELPVSITR